MAGLKACGPSLIEDAIEHVNDPLAELGLSPGSYSKEEIKSAYRTAVKKAHPDRSRDAPRFIRMHLAFLALTDFAAPLAQYGMFGAVRCQKSCYEAALQAQAHLSSAELSGESSDHAPTQQPSPDANFALVVDKMGNGLVVPCAKLVALEDTHRLASANEKVTFVSKAKSRDGRSSQVCMLPTPDVPIRRDCEITPGVWRCRHL